MTGVADIPHRTFYVMRHARSNYNDLMQAQAARGEYGPDNPPPPDSEQLDMLSNRGFGQGFLAGKIFEALNPRPMRVVTSAKARAVETAMMMTGHEPAPGDQDARLNEVSVDGEADEHKKVLLSALKDHIASSDETRLFVSHGRAMRTLLDAFGVRLGTFDAIGNTDVFRFDPPKQPEGQWSVRRCVLKEEKIHEVPLPSVRRQSGQELLARYMKKWPDTGNGSVNEPWDRK
jgi:broad specificity phosphatase PhoE